MGAALNLEGKKYHRLLVLKKVIKNNRLHWQCICDCGNKPIVRSDGITSGHAKSCGCLQKEAVKKTVIERKTKHGLSKSRIYNIYLKIKKRCLDESDPAFMNYGGRGITIDPAWLSFESFLNDMYESYQIHCNENGIKRTSIDRIENNKGYSKDNCRWATPLIQASNRRNRREGSKVNQYK